MAAPVVAGTVALMLQANPTLTPNLVKAILQYTAQIYRLRRADAGRRLPQRAGRGGARAVLQAPRRPVSRYPMPSDVEQAGHLGQPPHHGRRDHARTRNAWQLGTIVWGAAVDGDGDNIVWGTLCERRRQHRLGHRRPAERRQHRLGHGSRRRRRQHRLGHVQRTTTTSSGARSSDDDNIVWGTDCGGSRTATTSSGAPRSTADNIVWGTLRRRRQHRLGHRAAPATTSSGARAATSTTSCGARRPTTTT